MLPILKASKPTKAVPTLSLSLSLSEEGNSLTSPNKKHGFTLIEIIIVIIIVGILAAIGITQYSNVVEKSRLAEAKVHIGAMRQLAYEYYLNNGTLTGITSSDIGADFTCLSSSFGLCWSGSGTSTTNFYSYWLGGGTSTWVNLVAGRSIAGGKIPNASREYVFYLTYGPGTGQATWHCQYCDDNSSCFGYPP
ncbi:prepilin-type N-terminal cleavage/methylation domain-containing protein [bacterium]|nr:MAG: prepilin-type N-terminal cleavage/methylation domain-containing protein [bacterium]